MDDAHQATHIPYVLKVRERPEARREEAANRRRRGRRATNSSDGSESESDGSDIEDSKEDQQQDEENEEEEKRREASKATAYFDSSHVTVEDNTIDSFSQVGLLRSFLRDVASIGL